MWAHLQMNLRSINSHYLALLVSMLNYAEIITVTLRSRHYHQQKWLYHKYIDGSGGAGQPHCILYVIILFCLIEPDGYFDLFYVNLQ